MPLGLTWFTLFFLASFFLLQAQRRLASLLLILWLMVGVAGNGWIAEAVMGPLEHPRDLANLAESTPFRSVILLGGGVSIASDGTPELNREGQRVLLAAQLWHLGKARTIVCTGTSGGTGLADPSATGRELLVSVGVDNDDIYEVKGRNTSEEMRSLKMFFDDPPAGVDVDGQIGLVTSAFHIPRAMRLANQQDLQLVPLPCGHQIHQATQFDPSKLIPKGHSASMLAAACKEWLARLMSR